MGREGPAVGTERECGQFTGVHQAPCGEVGPAVTNGYWVGDLSAPDDKGVVAALDAYPGMVELLIRSRDIEAGLFVLVETQTVGRTRGEADGDLVGFNLHGLIQGPTPLEGFV